MFNRRTYRSLTSHGYKTFARAGASALLAVILGIGTASLQAKSIFDDDYKPTPDSVVKPDAKPADKPPEAPVPRRLPAVVPNSGSPAAIPATPTASTATPSAPLTDTLRPPAPIPTAAALAPAQKMLREVFKAEYASRTPSGKAALGRALFNEASQGSNDLTTEYAILREARDSAMAGGDVITAMGAARGLRDDFAVGSLDANESERSTLASAIKNLLAYPPSSFLADDYRAAVRLSMLQAESELAGGRYETAVQSATQAYSVAKLLNDFDIGTRVHARLETLTAIAADAVQVRTSFVTLKSTPDDPAANLAVGRFFAFVLDRLDAGLPYLAKSSDAGTKHLVAQELAMPTASAEQMALGDGWAAVYKTTFPGVARDGIRRRALFWYDAATASGLDGFARLEVAKRAADLRTPSLKHGLTGDYFYGCNPGFKARIFSRVDPQIDFAWNGLPPGEGAPRRYFTVRWTGYIKSPSAGDYTLVAFHDDGVRIWVDGVPVMDHWEETSARDSNIVHLNGGLQQLKIEYFQSEGSSGIGLGWIPPGGAKAHTIPGEALLHDPSPADPYLPPAHREADGKIDLVSAGAQIHHESCIFYKDRDGMTPNLVAWRDAAAWISWDFNAPQGDYQVDAIYSCGEEAGSDYAVVINNRHLPAMVISTGSWNDFTTQSLGQIHIGGGGQVMSLQAIHKVHDGLMNFDRIVLTPIKK